MSDPPHYPSDGAKRIDLTIHLVGLALSLAGGLTLLRLSRGSGGGRITALAVYASGLVSMLAFSTAYNFSTDLFRPMMRRLDHAGIFLMIAGSYTPFTTQILSGGWAWGMTVGVWSIAGAGILAKLTATRMPRGVWIAIYLGLGWMVIVAIGPISARLSTPAMALLAVGGIVYTSGAAFYATRRLKFWRPVWHAHVVVAAAIHWSAIFIATVSVPAPGYTLAVEPKIRESFHLKQE